jgi:hypothetical protein
MKSRRLIRRPEIMKHRWRFDRVGDNRCVKRADAKAKGVRFGRKPKLTAHQQREARERIEAGETQRSVARSYNVSQATISRLAA